MLQSKSAMTEKGTSATPELPIPIFRVSPQVERYMLYDVNIISWLRKHHNILGVLIGTIPQVPQQNVFLGLPLQLLPEEARLLVADGIAYVVYDLSWHRQSIARGEQSERMQQDLRREGLQLAQDFDRRKHDKMLEFVEGAKGKRKRLIKKEEDQGSIQAQETLFQGVSTPVAESLHLPHTPTEPESQPWIIVPSTAESLLGAPAKGPASEMPFVKPANYALFEHLHRRSYFMIPGLRFGCQYSVYPGDPLRFHSHFLASGLDWDEDMDLLDLIGGGRLSTGVKKGWMIGGVDPTREVGELDNDYTEMKPRKAGSAVRIFCIEWGGM